jgi:hypothetical protein
MRVARPTLLSGPAAATALRYAPVRAAPPVMMASVDFTSTAANLFANVRLPASIVAGVLIPLTFGYSALDAPPEGSSFFGQPTMQAALARLYRIFAIWSYCTLLVAIVYSSVAINSLAETSHGPAKSVAELIMNECESLLLRAVKPNAWSLFLYLLRSN